MIKFFDLQTFSAAQVLFDGMSISSAFRLHDVVEQIALRHDPDNDFTSDCFAVGI